MSIDLFVQNAKVVKDNEGDYIATAIYHGIETIGVGETRQEALQHLKAFLIITEEEYQAGRVQ
jgi:hypothetical protein